MSWKKSNLSRPVSEIAGEIVEAVPGYTPADQLIALYDLARSNASLGGYILEIGSWCGRSATILALAQQTSGDGKVYAVDLFPECKDWHENEDGTFSIRVTIEGKEIAAFENIEPKTVEMTYRRHQREYWHEEFCRCVITKELEGAVTAYKRLTPGSKRKLRLS